jgi:hypothetical protein
MFDAVRIRRTPETEALGYADAEGELFGVTTVSVTGVKVIGEAEDDCALNVDFGGAQPNAWFQPSLVEVIGQPAVTLSVGPRTIERREGETEWREVGRRPWWKFWA